MHWALALSGDVEPRFRPGVLVTSFRKPSVHQGLHPRPRRLVTLAPTPERPIPVLADLRSESPHGGDVGGNCVVREIAAYHRTSLPDGCVTHVNGRAPAECARPGLGRAAAERRQQVCAVTRRPSPWGSARATREAVIPPSALRACGAEAATTSTNRKVACGLTSASDSRTQARFFLNSQHMKVPSETTCLAANFSCGSPPTSKSTTNYFHSSGLGRRMPGRTSKPAAIQHVGLRSVTAGWGAMDPASSSILQAVTLLHQPRTHALLLSEHSRRADFFSTELGPQPNGASPTSPHLHR